MEFSEEYVNKIENLCKIEDLSPWLSLKSEFSTNLAYYVKFVHNSDIMLSVRLTYS